MNKNFYFKNILVVGLGLIGGSILRSLQSSKFQGVVYGLDLKGSYSYHYY